MPQNNDIPAVDSPIAPAQNCFAIEPSDTAELAAVTKALFIGEGGDVTLRTLRGTADVTFRNLPNAYVLDVRAIAVRATGTSAGNIVGLA